MEILWVKEIKEMCMGRRVDGSLVGEGNGGEEGEENVVSM